MFLVKSHKKNIINYYQDDLLYTHKNYNPNSKKFFIRKTPIKRLVLNLVGLQGLEPWTYRL